MIKNLPMLFKIFMAFILFLAIPLIITGIFFNLSLDRSFENEISKSVTLNLTSIKNMNEVFADSISKDVAKLSVNNDLDELADIENYSTMTKNVNDIVKVMKVFETICNTANLNNKLHSIYVYPEGKNYLITSNRGILMSDSMVDMGWADVYRAFKNRGEGSLWLTSRLVDGADATQLENNVITYVYPLSPLTKRLSGAIIVNVYEDEFSKLINNSKYNKNGYVFVIDQTGNVISHVDKSLIATNIGDKPYISSIIRSGAENGYVVVNMDGSRKIITYYKSEAYGWIYLSVYSMDQLLEKANDLRLRMIGIISVFIVLGILLSYVFSKRLCNPINQLVQDIKKQKGIDLKGSNNEMVLLSRAFAAITKQEDNLKINFTENYLKDLLKGNIQKYNDMLSQVETCFPYEYFICAVITIDRVDLFLTQYPNEQQYYYKMLIIKICEEIFSSNHAGKGILLDKNRIALIINLKTNENNKTALLVEGLFKKVQQEMSKVLDYSITVGIGGCHKSIDEIKTSFDKAEYAIRRKIIFGHGSIILWNGAAKEDNKYFYPYNREKHIFNYLNVGSIDDITSEIDGLMDEIKANKDISCDNIMQIFNQLIGNTIKYLVESNINISDMYGNGYSIYQKLTTKETLYDIKVLLIDFYSRIITTQRALKSGNKSYIERILDYIKVNYKKELDIDEMVKYTGISYSYMRQLIKDSTDKNITDILNGYRIDEAKRLLRQTNMSLMEIAADIGYNNVQSFNRFFKKYEAITPGEFRNLKDNNF